MCIIIIAGVTIAVAFRFFYFFPASPEEKSQIICGGLNEIACQNKFNNALWYCNQNDSSLYVAKDGFCRQCGIVLFVKIANSGRSN